MEFAIALPCTQKAILNAVVRYVTILRTHKPNFILMYLNIILKYTHMHPKLCLSLRISDKKFACISHLRMRDLHPTQLCFHLINLMIFGAEQNL
jgi:hypothetical protein